MAWYITYYYFFKKNHSHLIDMQKKRVNIHQEIRIHLHKRWEARPCSWSTGQNNLHVSDYCKVRCEDQWNPKLKSTYQNKPIFLKNI